MLKTFLISLWIFTQAAHPTFTGVTSFPDKGMIKVFLKMNYNDFVFDYRFTIDDDQNFERPGEIDTSRVFLRRYLDDRIRIFGDDKELKGRITGFQLADGELNIDILYYYNKRVKNLKVRNTMLNGVNKNPSNMLIFKCNNLEDAIKLTEEKPEKIFKVR
jgi:Domain of unknown function (DUF6702)